MATLTSTIFIIVAILFFANAQVNDTIQNSKSLQRCGYVYDGAEEKNSFDLDFQHSKTTLSGNWFGFETPINAVTKYEWSIVSDSPKYLSEDYKSGPAKSRCRSTAGFEEEPDILSWTDIGTETVAHAHNLNLEVGKTYYIVLRVHLSLGGVVYSNSDGVTIVDEPSIEENSSEFIDYIPETLGDVATFEASETIEIVETLEAVETVESVEDQLSQTFGQDRDFARERQRFETCFRGVGFYLTELYGPPIFVRDPTVDKNVAVLLTFESDSESGLTDAQMAGIIIAVVVFVLLLLLLLPALKSSKKANKFQTNPHRTENIENI